MTRAASISVGGAVLAGLLAGCAEYAAPDNIEARRLAECIAYDEVSYEARQIHWGGLSPEQQRVVDALDDRVAVYCDPATPATLAGNAIIVTATVRLIRVLR